MNASVIFFYNHFKVEGFRNRRQATVLHVWSMYVSQAAGQDLPRSSHPRWSHRAPEIWHYLQWPTDKIEWEICRNDSPWKKFKIIAIKKKKWKCKMNSPNQTDWLEYNKWKRAVDIQVRKNILLVSCVLYCYSILLKCKWFKCLSSYCPEVVIALVVKALQRTVSSNDGKRIRDVPEFP